MEAMLNGLTVSEITFKVLFIAGLIFISRSTKENIARLNDRIDYLTDRILEQKKDRD
jgi:hypothetical protein